MTAPYLLPDDAARSTIDTGAIQRARTDAERLAAVRQTGLLDSEIEEVFDRLTRLAVKLVGIPASFISLVDENRDFYKSACGFGATLGESRQLEGPTFCHYAILRTTPLVIPDTAADPLYQNVPTIRTLGVAAYVGVPLLVGGQVIGSFCAIDTQPHPWTDTEVDVLVALAATAQREIELRGSVIAAETMAWELDAARADAESARADAEAARETAESANRAKSDFLAMMSHELRTPLNAIGGYAELLELGIPGPINSEQRGFLERLQRSQRHLLGLINGVLHFAKVEAGALEYDVTDVPLDEVVATCEALLAPQLRARRLAFIHESCDASQIVRGDREKVQQIVLNLAGNAVKFTDAGSVTLRCARQDAGHIALSVSDTGRGIPADLVERVFEPFIQVATEPARRQEGTGLGLAISRELARGMDGDILLESEDGVGSTFTLVLPAAATG